MNIVREKIRDVATRYGLQIIYAFGNRAKEASALVEGKIEHLSPAPSDLDIGVKPERPLTVESYLGRSKRSSILAGTFLPRSLLILLWNIRTFQGVSLKRKFWTQDKPSS